jgi:hypothetical protein
MVNIRRLILIAAILIPVLSYSCKKDKPPVPAEEPIKVDRELLLSPLASYGIEDAKLGMVSTTDGDNFFVTGGHNPYTFTSKIDIYNVTNQLWSKVPLSLSRSGSVIATLKGKVFVGGGSKNIADRFRVDIYDILTGESTVVKFGDNQSGHNGYVAIIDNRYVVFHDYRYFHVYDTQENKWETIDIPYQDRVKANAMVAVGKKLYFNVFDEPNVLRVYDFKEQSWTKITSSKLPSNISLATSNDLIYFYGNQSFDYLRIIDVFDTKTEKWSTIQLPEDRAFYSMSIDKESNCLIITGGCTTWLDVNNNKNMKMSDDLLIYHNDKKSWKRDKIKTERYGHTMQIVKGQFIIHGGQKVINGDLSGNLPTEVYKVGYQPFGN